ncbi:MAG TPA: peptidoglycan-binding domain-containing protein [Candidatus Paceibacterota bacterium]
MNLSRFSKKLAAGIAAIGLTVGMLAGGLVSVASAQQNIPANNPNLYNTGTNPATDTGAGMPGTVTPAAGTITPAQTTVIVPATYRTSGFYNNLGQWVALQSLFGNNGINNGGLFNNGLNFGTNGICSTNMAIGTTGTQVTSLQQALANAGYLPASDVTGFFGPITQSALANACRNGGIGTGNLGNLWAAAALFGNGNGILNNGVGTGVVGGTNGGFYNSLGQWVALQQLFGNGGYLGNGYGTNFNNLGNLWAAAALFGNGNGTTIY